MWYDISNLYDIDLTELEKEPINKSVPDNPDEKIEKEVFKFT